MSAREIRQEEIDAFYEKLKRDVERAGYHLNPDVGFTKDLIRGMLRNQERYGYPSCPCRLASGKRREDLDIICPCDYRDPDLADHDACYCALYVSNKVVKGEKEVASIPERRPPKEKRALPSQAPSAAPSGLSQPVWRCRVCGYLCARSEPPEVCPICKASRDRFEKFM